MTKQDTTVAMRRCIGSTKFGIEAHEAPENEFPVQPSQKDGLGRMCHEHWRQYTNALRKAALVAAKRIGKVEVDHGDTACKTPDAAEYIEKAWAYAKAKGFESPAAQERMREVPRRRC